jgi:maleate isomerase
MVDDTGGSAAEPEDVTVTGSADLRIGALVIHNDPVPETEFWLTRPPGVTVHTARFQTPRATGEHFLGRAARALLSGDVEKSARQLAELGTHAIGYCFVSSSVFGGTAFDDEFESQAEEVSAGVPVVTAGRALRAAVRARSAGRRVVIVVPPWFSDETVSSLLRYLDLDQANLRTLRFELGSRWAGIPRPDLFDAGARHAVTPSALVRQVEGLRLDGTELIVIPGSGMRSAEAQKTLGERFGVETMSANSALLDALVHEARTARSGSCGDAVDVVRRP